MFTEPPLDMYHFAVLSLLFEKPCHQRTTVCVWYEWGASRQVVMKESNSLLLTYQQLSAYRLLKWTNILKESGIYL